MDIIEVTVVGTNDLSTAGRNKRTKQFVRLFFNNKKKKDVKTSSKSGYHSINFDEKFKLTNSYASPATLVVEVWDLRQSTETYVGHAFIGGDEIRELKGSMRVVLTQSDGSLCKNRYTEQSSGVRLVWVWASVAKRIEEKTVKTTRDFVTRLHSGEGWFGVKSLVAGSDAPFECKTFPGKTIKFFAEAMRTMVRTTFNEFHWKLLSFTTASPLISRSPYDEELDDEEHSTDNLAQCVVTVEGTHVGPGLPFAPGNSKMKGVWMLDIECTADGLQITGVKMLFDLAGSFGPIGFQCDNSRKLKPRASTAQQKLDILTTTPKEQEVKVPDSTDDMHSEGVASFRGTSDRMRSDRSQTSEFSHRRRNDPLIHSERSTKGTFSETNTPTSRYASLAPGSRFNPRNSISSSGHTSSAIGSNNLLKINTGEELNRRKSHMEKRLHSRKSSDRTRRQLVRKPSSAAGDGALTSLFPTHQRSTSATYHEPSTSRSNEETSTSNQTVRHDAPVGIRFAPDSSSRRSEDSYSRERRPPSRERRPLAPLSTTAGKSMRNLFGDA